MYYTIYKVTNIINGKYYIGKHKTINPNDSYLGSGSAIKNAINKYGKHNFVKEVLHVFETEQEMNNKEKELVIIAENTYNLTEGGRGGFSFIHKHGLNSGANNVMHNSESKRKQTTSMMDTRNKNKKHYDGISKVNLQKAIDVNTGKKRPEHSQLMKKKSFLVELRNKDPEAFRDLISTYFEVTSPNNNIFKTNRLEDFCVEHNLGYVALWNTSRTNKPVSKGKSKGWICQKLAP